MAACGEAKTKKKGQTESTESTEPEVKLETTGLHTFGNFGVHTLFGWATTPTSIGGQGVLGEAGVCVCVCVCVRAN